MFGPAPVRNLEMRKLIQPTPEWGPAKQVHRTQQANTSSMIGILTRFRNKHSTLFHCNPPIHHKPLIYSTTVYEIPIQRRYRMVEVPGSETINGMAKIIIAMSSQNNDKYYFLKQFKLSLLCCIL